MTKRFRPARVAPALLQAGYILTAAWAVALRVALSTYPTGLARPFYLRPFAFGAALVVANAITLYLSLQVGRDFRRGSTMWRAWQLMAWSSVFGIAHYAGIWTATMRGRGARGFPPLMAGGQLAGFGAVLLLLVALLMMRSPFVRLGLGRLQWTDWAGAGAVFAMTPALFILRRNAPPATFRTPVIEALQFFDPLLIAGCAIAGVIFLRISRDLEGGSLAVSFRYAMVFGMVRLLALLATLVPVGAVAVPFTAASLASDWLITMVVFYRWRLTRQAREMAKDYESRVEANGIV